MTCKFHTPVGLRRHPAVTGSKRLRRGRQRAESCQAARKIGPATVSQAVERAVHTGVDAVAADRLLHGQMVLTSILWEGGAIEGAASIWPTTAVPTSTTAATVCAPSRIPDRRPLWPIEGYPNVAGRFFLNCCSGEPRGRPGYRPREVAL